MVFDFVDRGQRHNQSLDLHRLLKMKQYRSGALVIAPPGQMEAERHRMQLGEKHRKDLNKVAFVPSLWKRLTAEDREKLVRICDVQITDYYEKRVNR